MASKQISMVPRLVKAADVAAQRAKRELVRKPVEVKAAFKSRTPRDARDARQLFDTLFGTGPAVTT